MLLNMVVNFLSRKSFDKSCKHRKILKVYDEQGIAGLRKLKNARHGRFQYMLNKKAIISYFSESWVLVGVLLAKYRSLDLFYYILPFIADNNNLSSNGTKLLHLLCCSVKEELTKEVITRLNHYLDEYKVDINCLDTFGRNCLYYVDNLDVYHYLVKRGAKTDIVDNDGCTHLQYMIMVDNDCYPTLLNTCQKVTDAIYFIMRKKSQFALRSALKKVSLKFVTERVYYDCLIFIAIDLICSPHAALLLNEANALAIRFNNFNSSVGPIPVNDQVALLDFLDSFLVDKCGATNFVRKVFLEKGYTSRLDFFGRIDDSISSICFKRVLTAIFDNPNEYFLMDLSFLNAEESFIGIISQQERISYLEKFIALYPHWNSIYKDLFIIMWLQKCFLLFDIRKYLYQFIQPLKQVILNRIIELAIYHTFVDVEFIKLCLDFGAVIQKGSVLTLVEKVSEYKLEILKVFALYDIPIENITVFNNLRSLLGPQLIPISTLQTLCINQVKRLGYMDMLPPHLLKLSSRNSMLL